MATKSDMAASDQAIVDEVLKLMAGKTSVFIEKDNPLCGKVKSPNILFRGLMPKGIVVSFPTTGGALCVVKGAKEDPKVAATTPAPVHIPKPKASVNMKYYEPEFLPDILAILKDESSVNVWLVGPTQCGKSRLVKHLGEKLCRKVYKISCRGDMDSTPFYGQKTVRVDENGNKVVVDLPGVVEMAMKEGLDTQGNVVGEPAILFIDECPSLPAHIAIGMNSFLETDTPERYLHLEDGRVLKSHPGLRVIMAGNTNGRGAMTMAQNMYAAQTNQLDMSLLNRIAVFFKMGYNKRVEHAVLTEMIDDPPVIKKLEDFRDALRGAIREGKFNSPFSTKRLIDIANSYRVFNQDMGKALFYSLVSYVSPEEQRMVIEFAKLKMGIEMNGKFQDRDTDYE